MLNPDDLEDRVDLEDPDRPDDVAFGALQARAILAWRELNPTSGELEGELEGGVLPGFADRVLNAQPETRPRLFAVESIPAALPPPPRRKLGRSTGLMGAAVATLAAAALLWFALGRPRATDESAVEVAARPQPRAPIASDPLDFTALQSDGTPGAAFPPDLGERIDDYIAGYGAQWGPTFEFSGVVLVARDGETVYARGFGLADETSARPNDLSTRFRLGLLTEPFTAIAILQLRDRGLLDLDDPVSRFLPEYPRGGEITIEQLLTHRSGIPNYTDQPYFHSWKAQAHTTDQLIARFSGLPLLFEPGTKLSPTNSGYYLLGAIIERVSGQPYGEFVEQNIATPAAMTHTSFGDAYASGQQANGHVWNDQELLDPPDPIDMSVFGGAGGLGASPLDLLAWDRALRDGSLLRGDSVAEMLSPHHDGYGYGFVVGEGYGQPVASFPGAIDGFNGALMRFLGDDTLVVVLCNTEIVPGSRIAQDVAAIAYGDAPTPRIEHREVKIPPGSFDRYIGEYGVTAATEQRYRELVDPTRFALLEHVEVRQVGDRLYLNLPEHGWSWMHPMGHHRFFFKDRIGNVIRFGMGKDERASTLDVIYQDARFELRRLGQ